MCCGSARPRLRLHRRIYFLPDSPLPLLFTGQYGSAIFLSGLQRFDAFLIIKTTLLQDGKKDNFSNNKISVNPRCKWLFGKIF